MELYGKKSKSIPQKIVIHLIELLLLWAAYWILFQQGGAWCENHLHIRNAPGSTERRAVIFLFNIIIFLRLAYMMAFLLKREIPWDEAVSIPFAFALYFVGYPLFVLPVEIQIGWFDYFAITLFVIGCVLNSGGEILRNRWKKRPENKGKIYTEGLFKYSRHINYFGDLLWVTGYALITRNWYAVTIPLFLFSFFAFYNAPKLDKYLKDRYGTDFDEYAKCTKMLIPYIF